MLLVFREEPFIDGAEALWAFVTAPAGETIEPETLRQWGPGKYRVWSLDVGKEYDKKVKGQHTQTSTLKLEATVPFPELPKVQVH